jgi:glucan phosphoethanolaminetransferase (alkaline phosphatase superfamily)
MSIVHMHLLLNHVPVIGTLFVLLLLAVAVWRRSTEIGKLALFCVVGVALVAGVVFLTGEPAEEAVEHVVGVSESIIHEHEETAEAALFSSGLAGVVALVMLWWYRRRELPRWVAAAALVLALGVGGLMARTANLGGQIRHSEIRAGATVESHGDIEDR